MDWKSTLDLNNVCVSHFSYWSNHGNWRAMGVTGVGHAFALYRVLVSPQSREEATFKSIETRVIMLIKDKIQEIEKEESRMFLKIGPIITS
jgi:hypothetical protein